MSDMKCPFCEQELDTGNYYVHCHNPHCNTTVEMEGTEEMWLALRRTRKALDVAVDALKSAHEYYQNCIIRERQPHEINWYYTAMNMDNDIFNALDQITALEQKD